MNELNAIWEKAFSQPDTLLTIDRNPDSNENPEINPGYSTDLQLLPVSIPGKNPLYKVFEEVVKAMGDMLEVRDVYTAGHQRRVSRICVQIAKSMALSAHQIKGIQLAAMIHDIGKLAIPAEILSKPGRLSTSEFELIKTHCVIGHSILRDIEFPWPIAQTVLQHHERINGSGYPNKLAGHDILLEARILSVADVIEAMASDRPYRPSLGIDHALEEISRNRDTLYDGNAVDVCLQLFKSGDLIL